MIDIHFNFICNKHIIYNISIILYYFEVYAFQKELSFIYMYKFLLYYNEARMNIDNDFIIVYIYNFQLNLLT